MSDSIVFSKNSLEFRNISDNKISSIECDANGNLDISGGTLITQDISATDISCVNLYTQDISATDISCVNLYTQDISATDISCVNLYTQDISATDISCVNLYTQDISATDIRCTELNVTDNLVVNAAGNVGIGTTNPTRKLQVAGDVTCTSLHPTANGSGANSALVCTAIKVSDRGDFGSNQDTTIGNNIVTGGNVGIGTTSPSKLLHIFNTSTDWDVRATIRLQTDDPLMNAYQDLSYYRGTEAVQHGQPEGLGEGLRFGNGETTHMTILSTGNVGIGITNPSTKLEVDGGFRCVGCDLGTITPTTSFGSRAVMLKVIHDWDDTAVSNAFVKLHVYDPNPGQETRGAFMDFYAVPNYGQPGSGANAPRRGVRINGRDGKVEVSNSVGTATLEVSSDDRIKHNEVDISNALTTVNKLKSKFYIKTSITDTCGNEYSRNHNFTSNGLPENAQYESGYIAQDISNIAELNHLVSGSEYDASGNPTALALNYIGIQPYLTKAIQELSVLNDEKTAQIASMQTTITDLQTEIQNIKTQLQIQ